MNSNARFIDKSVLKAIAAGVDIDLSTQERAQASADALSKQISDPALTLSVVPSSDNPGQFSLRITRKVYGTSHYTELTPQFASSEDYQAIRSIGTYQAEYLKPGAKIVKNVAGKLREKNVDSINALYEWLVSLAYEGITLQRFKGLGEMNADELGQTTMDRRVRRMLKVSIPDAVKANEVFEKLMGDDVLRRRQYIEENAHRVSNLDI